MIDKNNVKKEFAPGEIDFSEKKKAIDIYTATNALYFPHYYEFPHKGSIESYLVFSRNAKGTNMADCIFIPLNPEVLYVTPDNISSHAVYGKKIQTALGIKDKEYNEVKTCRVSNEYIGKIQKNSLRKTAVEIWSANVESLKEVAEAHPESEGLQTAVAVLNNSKNNVLAAEMSGQSIPEK